MLRQSAAIILFTFLLAGPALGQEKSDGRREAPLWEGLGGEVTRGEFDPSTLPEFCPIPDEPPLRLLHTVQSLIDAGVADGVDFDAVYQFLTSDNPEPLLARGPYGVKAEAGPVYLSDRWLVPVADAKCGDGQVAVRTRKYPKERGAGSVEEAYTEYVDSEGYYCLSEKTLHARLQRTILDAEPTDDSMEHYVRSKYTALPLSDPEEVSFTPYDHGDPFETDVRNFIYLRKFTGTHPACEKASCTLVQFEGPMYGDCGCRPQGYTLLMDADGNVVEFLSSTLRYGRRESFMTRSILGRLVQMSNDPDQLRQAYATDPRKGEYMAKKSIASHIGHIGHGTGATVAAVIVHISKVRERLLGKANQWPVYSNPQPQ